MIITTEHKVINGRVQKVKVYDWPKYTHTYSDGSKVTKEIDSLSKQYLLLNLGYSERAAYMIAFNISEQEMQRIENS